MSRPLVKCRSLSQSYRIGKRTVQAVHKVDLEIYQRETFGLVGESGCGKSSLARSLLYLDYPTSGHVEFQGVNLGQLKRRELTAMRRNMQLVFQDPYASLNPRMPLLDIIGEPLDIHRLGRKEKRQRRVAEVMHDVGLSPELMMRYPHEFSGGQRQRIGIARALASRPKFIICDEPISALDLSIQAQVINLLKHLQKKFGLTYLIIAHDLAMIRHVSDRVGVMYLGHFCEIAPSETLYTNPLHPYTQALLSAVPLPDPRAERNRSRIVLTGDVPSPLNPPPGCAFHTRCPKAMARCSKEVPKMQAMPNGALVACHLYDDENNRPQLPQSQRFGESLKTV